MYEYCKTAEAAFSALCLAYNWQPLIIGIVAVAAAITGHLIALRAIRVNREHERERLRRRFNAARATLTHTLSDICEYARNAADALKSVHEAAGQHGFGASTLTLAVPSVPDNLQPALEQVIEAANDDSLADVVAELLADIQVLNARMRDLSRRGTHQIGLQENVEDYIIQAARIYAKASSLFGFARREVGTVAASEKKTVLSALLLMNVDESDFPALISKARRRYPVEGGSPALS